MRTPNCNLHRVLLCSLALTLVPALHAEQPPTRIVSTDAGVTELLLALGAESLLVAVDDSSQLSGGTDLPRLGYHRALAAEGLVSLAPDLVLGSTSMGPPHVVAALQRSSIRLLQLPTPLNLDMLRGNITALQQALAVHPGSSALQADLDAKAARLASLTAASPLRAVFLLRAEAGKLRMAGSDTAGAAFIDLLGAENLADYSGYRSLSAEALLALEPELLLFADTGGGTLDDITGQIPLLRFSPALQQGRAFLVDANALVAGLSLTALDEALRVATTLATRD